MKRPCTPAYHFAHRWPQRDARGYFLAYSCPKCHEAVMAGYRPDVLTDPNYWADEAFEED